MTEEQLIIEVKKAAGEAKNELETLIKNAKSEIQVLTAKGADSKEIWEKHNERIEEVAKNLSLIQDQMDTLEAKGKRLGSGGAEKSFSDLLADNLTNHLTALTLMKKSKSAPGLEFDIKAAANMLISTNYSGGTMGLTTWDNEITRVPRREPFLRELFRVRRVNSLLIAWAEQANRDGGATTVAEGAAKPRLDFDIVEASKKVEKIAVWAKTSKEMLDDISYLRDMINQELVESVLLELDRQLWEGDNVSPNLKGITNYATTLSVAGTPFATKVESPTNADVLFVAESIIATNRFFQPNVAIVNPMDVAMMRMAKDADGNGLTQPYVTNGGLNVGGLRIVSNALVTAGTFLVGDFTKAILGIREDVNIQVGYENDDFTKNLVTILAEMRAVSYVKSNHVNAFVKGTFDTVKTAITAP